MNEQLDIKLIDVLFVTSLKYRAQGIDFTAIVN